MSSKVNISIILLFPIISGIIFINAGTVCAKDENKLELLIKEFEEKIAYNPYDEKLRQQLSVFYHNRANELAEKGLWQEASDHEVRALDLAPEMDVIKKTLAVYYNNYGLKLRDSGNFPDAVKCLRLAIDYSPEELTLKKNAASVYLVWADNLMRKNEYANAERMLVNAESFDKNNPYLYVFKGEIAYSRDNYFKAKDNWEKALELNSSLDDVRIKLEKLEKDQKTERNFKVKEIENFRLKFEGVDKQDLADEAAEILREAYRTVGQDYDLYPRATVPVIIYPKDGLKKSDYFPDWAAGAYDGKIRFSEDLIKNKTYMKAVLNHEYAHVVIRLLGQNNVPLWLNEGLAEYAAKQFIPESIRKKRKALLKRAFKNKTAFSIDKLGEMDLNKLSFLSGDNLGLVYAQSESFAAYIIARSSMYEMKIILEHLKNGDSIYKAVKDVLFVDLDVLERDWKSEFGY